MQDGLIFYFALICIWMMGQPIIKELMSSHIYIFTDSKTYVIAIFIDLLTNYFNLKLENYVSQIF